MAGAWSDALGQLRDRPMVFVGDLEAPAIDEADLHHLRRSLRVRDGAPITVADGLGRWRPARFGARPEPDGAVVDEGRPARPLSVGFAPVKGDRAELVVQKLTELGIDRIVPLLTERSVVRWDEQRAAKNLERHRRIAREAAMQSRNPRLPTIEPLSTLASFCRGDGAVLADPSGPPLGELLAAGSAAPADRLAIGPEGGFAPGELSGRVTASLPGRILRTETAAIAAGVLLIAADR